MANRSSGTVAFLKDALNPLGSIAVRRMFSGSGIYCDGIIFALVIDDTVYFKTNAASIPAFKAEGTAPFSFDTKLGRRSITSYWKLPDRLFDETDELLEWAKLAVAASVAAKDAKPKRVTLRKPV